MRQLILVSLHLVGHLRSLVLSMLLWSSSSELSEFLAMIQQAISNASSFTHCLEFIHESSLPLAGFDVCHPRHLIYLFFITRVILRVPTALYFCLLYMMISLNS